MQNIIEANAGNMMCLFNKSKVLLPFYNQKSVVIVIPFEEYVEFIRMFVSSDSNYMTLPRSEYQKALELYSKGKTTLMKRYYYFDVSYAAMLSLFNSSDEGKDATYIIHRFENESRERLIDSIYDVLGEQNSEDIKKAYTELHQAIDAQYPIQKKQLSKYNEMYLYYAWYLKVITTRKEFDTFNLQLEEGEISNVY